MRHPLLYRKSNLYQYLMVFTAMSCIHLFVLHEICQLSLKEALLDALVSNGLFAMLGLSSWYVVRYISMDHGSSALIWFNQWIAAMLFLSIWQGLSYLILVNALPSGKYTAFLDASILLRLLFGLFLYGFLSLSYYLYKYYYSFKARLQREADWNTLVKESELALLKSQLQPHFIFNSLNSIHALMLSDAERAQDMLVKLAAFLRLSMNNSSEKSVTLKEELENISLYSSIEKIRFGDRLMMELQIEEEALTAAVPHLLLQPLMENAIRHGLHQFVGTVTVTLRAVCEEKGLRILLFNNHDPEEKKQKGTGLGLKHVRQRLSLLFGRKDLVKIKDENGIFQIELFIPQY
ncbi:MAG: LytT family sensor histidine kinase [Chitinophagaceae bacterium]|nr:LytT family sensor histidine kinase [Chitinophagaceae bacterium]